MAKNYIWRLGSDLIMEKKNLIKHTLTKFLFLAQHFFSGPRKAQIIRRLSYLALYNKLCQKRWF